MVVQKTENLQERKRKIREQLAKNSIPGIPEAPWPQPGDMVYVLHGKGHVTHEEFKPRFKNYVKQGTIFRTAEEAEARSAANAYIQALWSCEGARRFIPGVENWMISVDLIENRLLRICDQKAPIGLGCIAFDSEQSLNAAIAKVTEARILAAQACLAHLGNDKRMLPDRRVEKTQVEKDVRMRPDRRSQAAHAKEAG